MFDIKGAVRIASSSDVVLKPSAEVLAKLKLKHPSPPPGMAKPVAPNQNLECISCTREDVRSAIQSFPNGSGAGIMGLYPQHLKDLTSKELGVNGDNLLDALKDFLNLIVFSGKIPDEATSTFYGAVLMALSKSDDSVRPIAIGLTLRRLAAKVIMPVPSLGLKLDDKSIRVACGLHLGCPLCHIHNCTCGKRVDPNGYHGLSYRMCYGRHSRHDHVNRLIKEALGSAEITSRLEPTGTSKLDKKRPDGISYYPFKNGRCLAWDYTCPDTLAISHVKKSTSKEAGKAASLAEDKKLKKYRHLNNDYYVVPVAIETLGSYGPYALDFIKDIGRRIKESTGEKRATSYLMQTIGIAIQRGNSQCILSTVKDSRKMDEVYYL